MNWLHDALGRLPAPDAGAAQIARARVDDILRPRGAFAALDDIAVTIAGWQRSTTPRIERPAALIFAADHGVAVASAVSAYPVEVTAAMLAAYSQGKATINALARAVGATVHAVDVGVGRPTGDICIEPAMTQQRFADTVDAAVAAAKAAFPAWRRPRWSSSAAAWSAPMQRRLPLAWAPTSPSSKKAPTGWKNWWRALARS